MALCNIGEKRIRLIRSIGSDYEIYYARNQNSFAPSASVRCEDLLLKYQIDQSYRSHALRLAKASACKNALKPLRDFKRISIRVQRSLDWKLRNCQERNRVIANQFDAMIEIKKNGDAFSPGDALIDTNFVKPRYYDICAIKCSIFQ